MGSAKRVVLAEPRSFCAGVRRAIAIIELAVEQHGTPLHVRKEIVHNHWVVRHFRNRGVVFVDSEDEVPEGEVVVFSAHGVSPAVRERSAERGLQVIDATCPLVSRVHQSARRHARAGRTLLLVGHAGHEEVEGTQGHAPERTVVVESAEDARALDLPAETPVAFLTQTTLSVDETSEVLDVLRERFTDVLDQGTSDICYASQNRQDAVKAVVDRSELVLVVGSRNSSNSVRMVEVARRHGAASHLVPDVSELDPSWLDGVTSVGLSAGASAPEHLVDEVLDRLAELGFTGTETVSVTEETVVFSPPGSLLDPARSR